MDVNIIEHDDKISATINSITYELSREITGGQFMELRKKSVKTVASSDGEQPSTLEVDSVEFDLWNLYYRLVEPKMTKEELLALPRNVYQSLTLLAGKMDNDEAASVADFLRSNSLLFQTSLSTLELSLDSPPAGSGATSE